MFDAAQKSGAFFFIAVYSCIDQALAFFNKMRSSFVANPNLTAVNIYMEFGCWYTGSSSPVKSDSLRMQTLNFVSLDSFCMSGVQRKCVLNSWSANNFPL
jgi:hypothetical protein